MSHPSGERKSSFAVWTARSDKTGEIFRNSSYTVELHRRINLEAAESRVYDSIAHHIPEEDIFEPDGLKTRIRNGLRGLGYKTRLTCTGHVFRDDDKVVVNLRRAGEPLHAAVRVVLDIHGHTTLESVWDRLMDEMGESRLARHRILNEQAVRRELRDIMPKLPDKGHQQGVASTHDVRQLSPRRMTDVLFEHTKVKDKARTLAESGQVQEAMQLLDKEIQSIEEIFVVDEHARSYLIRVLMDRLDLSLNAEPNSHIRAPELVPLLDRIYSLAEGLQARVLSRSNSKFSKRLRWYIAFQDRLRHP